LGEVEHTHIWWHYWVTDDGRVWDNPFEPCPSDYFTDGYACFCGATPPGVAPKFMEEEPRDIGYERSVNTPKGWSER